MSKRKSKTYYNDPPVAVALEYGGDGAPRVTAKGMGAVAERIIGLAETAKVPLHPDRALVKVLSRVELGDEIPETLYRAVAEVIAFAYLIKGKAPEGWSAPSEPQGESD